MAKINGWAGRILAGVIILSAAGVAGAALSNTTRLARIEADRFTSEDGLRVWQEIADIREDMARLPTEAPPVWFVSRIDRIDLEIRRLHLRLDELEDK
jgi:hypothetical protein